MMKNHPFHMVTPSPWPIITSVNTLTTILGMLKWITSKNINNLIFGLTMLTICSIMWWKDITWEATF